MPHKFNKDALKDSAMREKLIQLFVLVGLDMDSALHLTVKLGSEKIKEAVKIFHGDDDDW